MLFKLTDSKIDIDSEYLNISKQFSLSSIHPLIYKNIIELYKDIKVKDRYFYSDIVGAIYQKMFEKGLTIKTTYMDALLSCSYHIQDLNYKFLAFIKRDDEFDSEEQSEVQYYKKWNFKFADKDLKNPYDSRTNINGVFNKADFKNSTNVFFVAGTQHFETLNLRIKKAAILMSELFNNKFIHNSNNIVILSGRNNAFNEESRVIYSNESHTMKNLLVYRLESYTNNNLPENFYDENIKLEMNSRNTNENIIELIKILRKLEIKSKKLNLFIVSSTPHLLQISEKINENIQNIYKINTDANIYLAGSENPYHFFRVFNSQYIKYLMNEIIFRNSKNDLLNNIGESNYENY